MPLETIKHYPGGGRLLVFSSGKTKYIPSKKYTIAKSNLHTKVQKGNTKQPKRINIMEACDRFFFKIFDLEIIRQKLKSLNKQSP